MVANFAARFRWTNPYLPASSAEHTTPYQENVTTHRSLLRAQGFHWVEPQGAVRGHQAGNQRNKRQCGPHGGKRQRI